MDHVMGFVREYMGNSIDDLRTEHKSGKYSKLSECPSYKECKAYCNSYNELAKYYYGKQYRNILISPSKLVND